MINKKKILLMILLVVLFICIVLVRYVFYTRFNGDLTSDYIVIFNGSVGEFNYKTYIYKLDNGQANYGFKYINTVENSTSWASPTRKKTIIKRGEVGWTDEIFIVAKENNAYMYVTLPNDQEKYTIEEFEKMFLMN